MTKNEKILFKVCVIGNKNEELIILLFVLYRYMMNTKPKGENPSSKKWQSKKPDPRKHKKEAANKKHHTFDWKRLEDKPDDWEKIAQLSRFQENPPLDNKTLENPMYIQAVLEKFPYLTNMFVQAGYNKHVSDKTTKKKTSKKNELQMRIQQQNIKKEVDGIALDMTTLYPRKIRNGSMIIAYLEIIVWSEFLLKSKLKEHSMVVFLDMIISVNRVFHELNDGVIRNVFGILRGKANKYVNEDMYALLFQNPVLMVEPFCKKSAKGIRLYKEQRENVDRIVESVKNNHPILIGNQMPTGTGKTFLAVPLAKRIMMLGLKKTILFACSNELVCTDVARNALIADDLHLWLARASQDDMSRGSILLRPYKRCFSAIWKKVYKKNDMEKCGSIRDQWDYYIRATKRQPDIIVADLPSCLELLKAAPDLDHPFVCYIDEFISDHNSNKIMTEICGWLSPQTVLLSAILPKWDKIPAIVDSFMKRYKTTRDCSLHRVDTDQVSISCAVVDTDGRVTMPHHLIGSREELGVLIENMHTNPRIRRSYTPKHVYGWASDIQDLLVSVGKNFDASFPDISRISHKDVLNYAIDVLHVLVDHFDWLGRFQTYRPHVMSSINTHNIFTSQSYEYEGKTLFVSDTIMNTVADMSVPLLDGLKPINELLDDMERLQQKTTSMLDALDKSKGNASKDDRDVERLDILELASNVSIGIPDRYVVNSIAHFRRFHPEIDTCPIHNPRVSVPVITRDFHELDEMISALLYSGVGMYSRGDMTSFEKSRTLSYYRHLAFLCASDDITFGTDLPGIVNIVITAGVGERIPSGMLYQLMGRAGRVGKSYHANIIAGSEIVLKKLLSYTDDEDKEAFMMNEAFYLKNV